MIEPAHVTGTVIGYCKLKEDIEAAAEQLFLSPGYKPEIASHMCQVVPPVNMPVMSPVPDIFRSH